MKKLLPILGFLRLVNKDGQLSITNCAVLAMLIKVLVSPQCDLASITALITAIGAYHFDKFTSRRSSVKKGSEPSPLSPTLPDIAELRGEINKIKLAMGMTQISK